MFGPKAREATRPSRSCSIPQGSKHSEKEGAEAPSHTISA